MRQRRPGTAGFTLVEVLAALLVLAVLASAAAPRLAELKARALLRVEGDRLRETLLRARETAIVLGRQVVVCPSADGVACELAPAWEVGWIAFDDRDFDREPDPDEPVLDRAAASPPEVLIESSRARRRLRFAPSGMAFGSNATIRVCHRTGRVPGRKLILSGTGRLRTDRRGPPPC